MAAQSTAVPNTLGVTAKSESEAAVLPSPANVVRPKKRVLWKYLTSFVVMHLIAVLVFWPWLFSWTGALAFLVGVKMSQFGIPLCYHRLLAHRSFRAPKWLERTWVVCALCQAQDTPAKWVAWHRMHHRHTDDEHDPHSPLVSFLWSHVGWLIQDAPGTHDISAYHRYARDILDDPFYMFLEKHRSASLGIFLGHAALIFAGGAAWGWLSAESGAEAWRMGLSWLVWGVALRVVYVWHITWSVNSLSHIFGYRNYDTKDDSRNNWFVALITGGEGWHNNHHHNQRAASVQHRWWEYDANFYTIRFFERLGLVTDVVRPRLPNAEKTKH